VQEFSLHNIWPKKYFPILCLGEVIVSTVCYAYVPRQSFMFSATEKFIELSGLALPTWTFKYLFYFSLGSDGQKLTKKLPTKTLAVLLVIPIVQLKKISFVKSLV